jgi:hypothetical protein
MFHAISMDSPPQHGVAVFICLREAIGYHRIAVR